LLENYILDKSYPSSKFYMQFEEGENDYNISFPIFAAKQQNRRKANIICTPLLSIWKYLLLSLLFAKSLLIFVIVI